MLTMVDLSDNGFLDSVNQHEKTITFFGVGAHNQNGIIENKNKALTFDTCNLLLHGMRYWPQIIDNMFWSFSIKYFSEQMNILNVDLNGETPESKNMGYN